MVVNRESVLDLNLLVTCSRSVMSLFVLPVSSRSSSFLSQSTLTGVSYLAVGCESVSPVSVLPCDELAT